MKHATLLLATFLGLSFALLLSLYALIGIVEGSLADSINSIKKETSSQSLKFFIVPQEPSGLSQLRELQQQTQEIRKKNNLEEERDEAVARCIRKLAKNWRRNIGSRSLNAIKPFKKGQQGWEDDWKVDEEDRDKARLQREIAFHVNNPGETIIGFDDQLDRGFKDSLNKKFVEGKRVC